MSRYIDIHTHFPTGLHIEPQGVGIHPWHSAVKQMPSEDEFTQADLIGEIGLDYVCDVERGQQERVFRAQLAIAERLKKVVVLHCVKAFEPTMKILEEYDLRTVIFHGFIGSAQQAERATQKGYFYRSEQVPLVHPKPLRLCAIHRLTKYLSRATKATKI